MKDALEYTAKKRAVERWYQTVEFYVALTLFGVAGISILIVHLLEITGFDFK